MITNLKSAVSKAVLCCREINITDDYKYHQYEVPLTDHRGYGGNLTEIFIMLNWLSKDLIIKFYLSKWEDPIVIEASKDHTKWGNLLIYKHENCTYKGYYIAGLNYQYTPEPLPSQLVNRLIPYVRELIGLLLTKNPLQTS